MAKKIDKKPDKATARKADKKPDLKPAKQADKDAAKATARKADKKPDLKPDKKPDLKPAKKPDKKPDSKPANKSDAKLANKPDSKSAKKPDAKPANKPDAKPFKKPDPKPSTRAARTSAPDASGYRWLAEARALAPDAVKPPSMPVIHYLREALDLSKLAEAAWHPASDNSRPGLEIVSGRLSPDVASQIHELALVSQDIQSDLYSAGTGDDGASRRRAERARFLIDNLEAAVDFVLDDGADEPQDAELAALRQRSVQSESVAAVGQALNDYARLAQRLGDRMRVAGDFDAAWISEGQMLAEQLLAEGPTPPQRANELAALRDRLLTLLDRRVQAVRSAARYVYRNHPDMKRRFQSPYERRLRAEAARRKQQEGSKTAVPA